MTKLPKVNKKHRVFNSDRLSQKVVHAISTGLVLGIFTAGIGIASANTAQTPGPAAADISKVIVLGKAPMADQRSAYHYSHSSHASHASHASHYSHYSSQY